MPKTKIQELSDLVLDGQALTREQGLALAHWDESRLEELLGLAAAHSAGHEFFPGLAQQILETDPPLSGFGPQAVGRHIDGNENLTLLAAQHPQFIPCEQTHPLNSFLYGWYYELSCSTAE